VKTEKSKELIEVDCGVIGGGFAGCSTAIELAEGGKKVALFVKGKLFEDCNSYLTAGGLAAVPMVDEKPIKGDSFEIHIKETMEAGKWLNDKKIVKFCVENFYPEVIEWLAGKGVEFDKSGKGFKYDLHREGGHSTNRIFHSKDTTGIEIMKKLSDLVRKNPNIQVFEKHLAIDLITKNKFFKKKGKDKSLGFYAFDIANEKVKAIKCNGTFIATGGLGKVFLYTSNSDIATGDGFAMCYRAGLELANMEFIQFHPSVFYDRQVEKESERRFLLTEALRGAGAFLKTRKDSNEDFVLKYHPQGSKATRDIVTRAEDAEMRKLGLDFVWLDCTRIPEEKLRNDFKNSFDFCKSKGIDISKEPVPVVYAVHYSNGGVLVGKNSETAIQNCYAIGETAYTGLHGATRLASNSAPECILFGRLAAKHFLASKTPPNKEKVPEWNPGRAVEVRDKTTVEYYWETTRRTMTTLCGICRNKERLMAAKQIMSALGKSINEFYWNYKVSKDFLEARNISDIANLVVESALSREESRACHYREDFPEQNAKFLGITITSKKGKSKIRKIEQSKRRQKY